jgi:ATPase subunit of ABC transporter with duplicated ATPase domains
LLLETIALGQLHWLNTILRHEPNISILVTHDDELFASAVNAGAIGAELKLS